MGILIATRADLFPGYHGAAVKILSVARNHSRQGHRIIVFMGLDFKKYLEIWNGKILQRRYPPQLSEKSLQLSIRTNGEKKLLKLGIPRPECFAYLPIVDRSYLLRMNYLVDRYRLNTFQAEFPGFLHPCLKIRDKKGGHAFLSEHNVEFARLARLYPSISDRGLRWLRHIEVELCKNSDGVIVVSEKDQKTLVNAGVPRKQVCVIPHGVDLRAFKSSKNNIRRSIRDQNGLTKSSRVLVYHGPMDYPPNLEAVRILSQKIIPRLEKRGYPVHLLAIGTQPPLKPLSSAMAFTGGVKHLAPYLNQADLAVIPLKKGGGTRMKILEYFAAGLPVVSSRVGAEGLKIIDQQHLLFAQKPDAICDAIESIFKSRRLRNRLRKNAQQFVAPLDWLEISKRYLDFFDHRKRASTTERH